MKEGNYGGCGRGRLVWMKGKKSKRYLIKKTVLGIDCFVQHIRIQRLFLQVFTVNGTSYPKFIIVYVMKDTNTQIFNGTVLMRSPGQKPMCTKKRMTF